MRFLNPVCGVQQISVQETSVSIPLPHFNIPHIIPFNVPHIIATLISLKIPHIFPTLIPLVPPSAEHSRCATAGGAQQGTSQVPENLPGGAALLLRPPIEGDREEGPPPQGHRPTAG